VVFRHSEETGRRAFGPFSCFSTLDKPNCRHRAAGGGQPFALVSINRVRSPCPHSPK
jgi:hypothetical protein